jgi:hypothetical protein
MKLSPISRLLAAACTVFALSSSDAFAQPEFTPSVSAVATGNTVAITVGHMPAVGAIPAPILGQVLGILSYELVAYTPGLATQDAPNIAAVMIPGIAVGNGPLIVPAPPGMYALRVRGVVGGVKGPWSNEAVVAVGLEACVPGIGPQLLGPVAVDNNTGTAGLAWTPVPGALGYRVHWSRFPGQTELAEVVTGTSVLRQIPMNGTFFVRVESITNGCEPAFSIEASFTIEVVRRHLSAGEIISVLTQVRNAFPRAWSRAHHHGDPERYDFIILACRALYQRSGGTIGCNWRRAVVGDLSMDGLSVENPADGRYYFADVIAGAGGPNPSIIYSPPFHEGALLRDSSGRYAPHGFANPMSGHPALRTFVNYGPAGGW